MRITVACPAGLVDDANSFAMVMAEGPADAQTYGEPGWQDAQGNLYSAASFVTSDEWVAAAQSALTRPSWDVQPYTVNMTGAERAQAAVVFWHPDMGGSAPQAAPDALTAIAHDDGPEALAMMGLTRVAVTI
jgi:ornithine carbamoyltransferase